MEGPKTVNSNAVSSKSKSKGPKPKRIYYKSNILKYCVEGRARKSYFAKVFKQHFEFVYKTLSYCKKIALPSEEDIEGLKVDLGPLPPGSNFFEASIAYIFIEKNTLIFDLDETLFHTLKTLDNPCDQYFNMRLPDGEMTTVIADILVNSQPAKHS